ncbi:MAG: YtxH domain-containing protein [Acidobacteria bacterium]|nr:MAG: YtxH domain-containing protein [Acidobacteriota bacterium]
MKKWILPTLAVGVVVFLMTRQGRELQDKISDNFGDWIDNLERSGQRLSDTLEKVQSVLARCNRTLEQIAG